MTVIVERALALAGPDAVLASRPRGVPHVYVGPLTPSGRQVPRAGRTVCRARTRRLTVIPSERRSSLDPCGPSRVCARCSACLSRDGQAEPLTSRAAYLEEYSGATKADVAFALELAATVAEVDAAAHLSLVLFGVAGCNDGFTEHGRDWVSLHQLVFRHRGRVGAFNTPEAIAAADRDRIASENAAQQRASERKQMWREREDRIARLGFNNAVP